MTAATRRDRDFAARLSELPTPGEWNELFAYGFSPDSPTQVRDRALFLLMLRSGLRVGEAAALETSGLDMSAGRVDVPDVPGLTKRGARTTYFDKRDLGLSEAINAWLAMRGRLNPRTSRLFTTAQGRAIEDTTLLRQGLRKAAERTWNSGSRTAAGHHVHTHALRHSFATESINRGAPLNVVQAALGHEKPDMTLRYIKANPRQVSEWFDRNPW